MPVKMASTSNDDISSYLIGDTIKVYVGPKCKHYTVHKALLTQYKWFSKKILYVANRPSSRDSITLSSEDPKAFELLISWLYRRNLKAISTTDEAVAKEEVAQYIGLYLRACEWDMHELQNALLDRVRVRTTCEYGYFPKRLIKTIYRNTIPLSPLRSYIVDSFIYKGIKWNDSGDLLDPMDITRKSALKRQLDAGNQEFVLDCYEALFQLCAKSKIRDPDLKTRCVYHTHKQGEHCPR